MKCPRCKGEGKLEYPGFADRYFQCPKCNGTGELEMTNEEYIRTCSTEELTEFLITVAFEKRFKERIHWRGYANMHSYRTEVRQWLKEKHHQ